MDFQTAIKIVEEYKQDWALPGLLETLEQMRDSGEDDLTYEQYRAYRVVFREMAKLFAPA